MMNYEVNSFQNYESITIDELKDQANSLLNLVTEEQRPLRVCMNNGKEVLLFPQDLLAPICDSDFRLILLSAMRYAMGRNTCMPVVVSDYNTVHQRTQTHVQLHRLYDKAGEISAAIFRISSLQGCFFLRRQVEGKFFFFAHVDLLSGACPLFFPCGSRHCGITTAELIFLSGFAPIFNAHGNS